MSGDFIGQPKHLLNDRFTHKDKSIEEYNESTNLYSGSNFDLHKPFDTLRYGFLALNNVPHFHGRNNNSSCDIDHQVYSGCSTVDMWRQYHDEALDIARSIYLSAQVSFDDIERALVYNAFADHFLQDAFSSGHMGVARFSHRPIRVKLYHDEVSEEGLYVSNKMNDVWLTYGDGSLDKCPIVDRSDPDTRDDVICSTKFMVQRAGVMSISAVLDTMVSGSTKEVHSTESISEFIPSTFSSVVRFDSDNHDRTGSLPYSVDKDVAFDHLGYSEGGIDLSLGRYQQFSNSDDYYDTTYKNMVLISAYVYFSENISFGLTYGFSNHLDFVKGFQIGYDLVWFYNSPLSVAVVAGSREIDPRDIPEPADGEMVSDDDCEHKYIGFRFTPEWSRTVFATIAYGELRDERFFKGSSEGIYMELGYRWSLLH